MLPFGVAFGFIRALFAAAFFPQSLGTRVVCFESSFRFFCEDTAFGRAMLFFGVAFAVIFESVAEARGGEGGRPVEGAR